MASQQLQKDKKDDNNIVYLGNLPKDTIVGFTTISSKEIRNVFDIFTQLGPELVITAKSSGLTMLSQTAQTHAYAQISGNNENFDLEEYVYEEKEIGSAQLMFKVATITLSHSAAVVAQKDVMQLYITKKGLKSNTMKLKISGKNHLTSHTFDIPMGRVLDITKYTTKTKKFAVSCNIPTQEWLKTLRVCKKNGDNVQMLITYNEDTKTNNLIYATKATGVGTNMWSKTTVLSCDMVGAKDAVESCWLKTKSSLQLNNDCTVGNKNCTCINYNMYSIRLLLSVARATNLNNYVTLFMNEGKDVIGVQYSISTIGLMNCYISPMQQQGSFDAKIMDFQ